MGAGMVSIWAIFGIGLILLAAWILKILTFKREALRYIGSLTGAIRI
jgi:hypothetical protein